MLAEFIDAVVDERGRGFFMQHRHLGIVRELRRIKSAQCLQVEQQQQRMLVFYLSTVKHFKLLGVVKGLVGILFGLGVFLKGRFGHLANSADHLGDLFSMENGMTGCDAKEKVRGEKKNETPHTENINVLPHRKNREHKAACALERHQCQ